MLSVKNWSLRIGLLVLLATSFTAIRAVYVPTNRDTKLPPEEVVYTIDEPTELELLYETTNFKYYFRETRDTIAIYDKRNGYTWKTGTDIEFNKDIEDECEDTLDLYEEQFVDVAVDVFGNFATAITNDANTILVELGEVRATIDELLDTDVATDVSFHATDLSLTQAQDYRITFDAYARDARDIQVQLGSDVDETITLTTDRTTYTIDFTLSDASAADFVLAFLMGNIGGDITATSVFLDDITIEEVAAGDVVDGTNAVSRGDFELLEAELTTTEADLLAACRPLESRLNTTYTGFANSLITIEYFDLSNNIKRVSSASHVGVDSDLFAVVGEDDHYRLDIDFKGEDIEIKVHIYFDDEGIRYEIRDEEITGEGTDKLAAIIIAPFMGASGGANEYFDLTELDYSDEEIFKYRIPGYALVPDGSGTLIRFEDNDVKLNPYNGNVYGTDVNLERLHYDFADNYVAFKEPSMPVFGIAHGDQQMAFVAYATSGDEYMQIISMPEDNLTYYNFTYPRFEYNKLYLQVYNKSGWGYLTLYEDRNHFDIDMRYDFLSGDGTTGPSADYVGMAKQYRNYLLDNDMLHTITPTYTDIPLRIDILMSDVEEGVTGFSNMVTTDVDGVDRILQELTALGITNINAGLLGWNDGGVTIGDPRKTDFTGEIGRKREFERLIETYNEQGIDISFQDDYYMINEEMMTLRRNASRHYNTWYSSFDTFEIPVNMFYFARPTRSIEWMQDHADEFDGMGVQSYSIAGITNHLVSDYTDDTTRTMAKALIIEGFAELNPDALVNAYQPNSYLWAYVDRYISTPVYGTQFLIETDTVPFLQLVLQGTMELYGPYSNFSFYTDTDVLRMIDYNIYPNFVLTDQPAYLLTDTNSKDFYSTEYALYEELVQSIYGRVNTALGTVIGEEWITRTVIANGVIVNGYSDGTEIVINYTQDPIVYSGITIQRESFEVVGD